MTNWVPIPSQEFYEASDDGRVRSVARHIITKTGQKRCYQSKELSPGSSNQYGHLKVMVNGRPRYIHRLVAEAFHGPCPDGMQVAHCDGNPKNNIPQNLRYATAAQNNADKRAHGTHLAGESHPSAKLSKWQVNHIRGLLRSKFKQKDIARAFGVSRTNISAIATGRSWA